MKIVRILGGIGNQMFQYAFYLALKQRFEDVKADLTEFPRYPLHNGYELESVFGIKVSQSTSLDNILTCGSNTDITSKIIRKIFGVRKSYYEQAHATYFDEEIFKHTSSKYYDGYWQNELYFKDLASQLKVDFTFKVDLDERNKDVLNNIVESNSIGIHVRRGDYINHKLVGGICDLNYYKTGIKFLSENQNNVRFFVFSNDISWCRENFHLDNVTYIDWNVGSLSYIDMNLMSKCKSLIIANSSFSWWSAWLNQQPGKRILAPSKWFNYDHNINEILPLEWKRI